MNKVIARRIALLLITAGALGSLGAKCGSGCKPMRANFVPNNFYWVGSDSTTPLDATDLSRGGLPAFTVGYRDCEVVAGEWTTIQSDLVKVHNALVERKQPTMSQAALLAVSAPILSPEFVISFTNDSLSASGGLSFKYAQTVSANLGASGQTSNIGLSIAQITSKLTLSDGLRACVRKNACIELGRRIEAANQPLPALGGAVSPREAPKSLQYVSQVLYGSSMILKISGATTSTNANVKANYGPYGGEVRFDLDTQHVSVLSSYFGSIKSIPDLEKLDTFFKDKRYDVPEMIDDLREKKLIAVMQRWSQLADFQNVVAVVLEEVTREACK